MDTTYEGAGLATFLVAGLLTAAFGSVSLLASGLVGRLILARQCRQWFTVATAGFCGAVLVIQHLPGASWISLDRQDRRALAWGAT